MFCLYLHFFRSVLVRYSAISSSDSRERHFFSSLFAQAASFPIIYTIETMEYYSVVEVPDEGGRMRKLTRR